MSEPPPVTVAVVSWNTREPLARCLESLRAEVEAGRAAVWVVDNGSEDGSRELVARRFGWAELVSSPTNLGFGAAVNLVAERSASPWIVAANADVELEPPALATLLAAGATHRRAGALAPRLLTPDGATQHSAHAFPSPGLALALNSGAGHLVPGLGDRLCLEGRWRPERERDVDWAHGALLLLRREAFEAVGGFDEAQWMYAEDLDLGWRLARAGWSTRYVPGARVRHRLAAATSQAFGDEDQRVARHVAAGYDWLARRRGSRVAGAVAALSAGGCALRLALIAPLARLRPERFARRRALEAQYLRLHLRALGSRGASRVGPAGAGGR